VAGTEARLRTVLACNNMEAVLGAALRGLGVACMPDFLVAEMLASGRLVSVLDDQLQAGGRFNALWPSSRHLPPKVRVFVDHLTGCLSSGAGADHNLTAA
jgi:DNA-binding transcriptional LysR family regulator